MIDKLTDPRARALALLATMRPNYREGQFLGGVVCHDRDLTDKQKKWLNDLYARHCGEVA